MDPREDSLPYSVEVSDTGDNHLQVVPVADGNRSELTGDLVDLNISLPCTDITLLLEFHALIHDARVAHILSRLH